MSPTKMIAQINCCMFRNRKTLGPRLVALEALPIMLVAVVAEVIVVTKGLVEFTRA